MIIAAASDIHYPYPKFTRIFISSLKNVKEVNIDIFILAGDIIHHGKVGFYKKVVEIIKAHCNCEIFACFGNEEYESVHKKLKKIEDVKFLEDEMEILKKDEMEIALIGSKGVLDSPTNWQMKNIPNIREIYEKRIEKLKNLLSSAKNKCDFIIFFSHYASTYKTLKGERKEIYPMLGSLKIEKILIEHHPDLVIHGHSHKGIKFCRINSIPVYNVAIPLNKKITIINTFELKTLENFWG